MPKTDIVDKSNNNTQETPLDGLIGLSHKVSEGVSFVDGLAKNRLHAALDAGIRYVIPYHVLRAEDSGAAQADFHVRALVNMGIDLSQVGLFDMNDWEPWGSGVASTQVANDYHSEIEQLLQQPVALRPRGEVEDYGGLPNQFIAGFPNIWLADYRPLAKAQTNPLWHQAAVWQWGNQAVGGGDTSEILDTQWLDELAGYILHPVEDTDMPTVLQVPGVISLISPTSGPTHIEAWWIATEAELEKWIKPPFSFTIQVITMEQLQQIRLLGTMPGGWTAASFADWAGPGTPGPEGPPAHGTVTMNIPVQVTF